jgi:hypothetical protein
MSQLLNVLLQTVRDQNNNSTDKSVIMDLDDRKGDKEITQVYDLMVTEALKLRDCDELTYHQWNELLDWAIDNKIELDSALLLKLCRYERNYPFRDKALTLAVAGSGSRAVNFLDDLILQVVNSTENEEARALLLCFLMSEDRIMVYAVKKLLNSPGVQQKNLLELYYDRLALVNKVTQEVWQRRYSVPTVSDGL